MDDLLCLPISIAFDLIFVASLMLLGMWLESINGKRGFIDELLTPIPMGLTALMVLFGRTLA